MNIVQVEENLKKITTKFSKDTFVFDLMIAYDFPKSTISKLKIKNKKHDDVVVPSKLHFVGVSKKELDSKFEELVKEYSTAKKAPRFIVVTDYQNLKAYDTKVAEKLDTEIKNLSKHPDFFLPWVGIEKKVFQGENPADVKAAEKLAKFFDLILKDNLKLVEKNRHALNVFLTRILFCFFAEDTDIFKKGLFTDSLASHTKSDGSDLDDYLQRLFEVLNKKSRTGLPDFLKEFPYVNGGLFAEEFPIPKFSKNSRESLIDLGSDLNWAEINPDIFGSMIQAVVHPDQRAGLGMHYTSVTNIMKVIEPLFLTELKEEFASAKGNKNKLQKLLGRIQSIKIFDPACGSGNFLIIAYKELRLLEMDILKVLSGFTMSGITLSNFYGIEIDDFAHEVAKLSLWLTEHQMNVLFRSKFGNVQPSLPLKDSGKIVCGNSTRIEWDEVCKKENKNDEIYILGNPPYLGATLQSKQQKEDVIIACDDYKGCRLLDYIGAWFYQASKYIKGYQNIKFGFVSTNSITQGTMVELLWPEIFKMKLEIYSAHQSFVWTNNAKGKAAVICIIVCIQNTEKNTTKTIFNNGHAKKVFNISPYLTEGDNTVVRSSNHPLNRFPEMFKGSAEHGDGNLILSKEEKESLLKSEPSAKKFIKRYMGSSDFINSEERYCIWILDNQLEEAKKIKFIKARIDKVYEYRKNSDGRDTKKTFHIPHKFTYARHNGKPSIIVPRVSSERRKYIPIGFLSGDIVVSDAAQAIFDPPVYIFPFLTSNLHNVWVKATAGRLKNDMRYSSALNYYTFPVPELDENTIATLSNFTNLVLSEREKYPDKTLAELYDPKLMPQSLRLIHDKLDAFIDSLYKRSGFKDDVERLECLLSLYSKLKKD